MRGERRMRYWKTALSGAVALVALCAGGGDAELAGPEEAVSLTAAEAAWLAAHPVVKVAFDPDWTPIEYFDEQGRPAGLSGDYLGHLEHALKARFEPQRNLTWSQVVQGLTDGSIDMASAIQKTEQRESFLRFTAPYMSLPIAIFTKRGIAYADTGTLKGKPVAVIRGFAVHDYLALHHPEIPVVPVKTLQEGLGRVSQGRVFAFVEVFAIGSHGINHHGFSDLHASGTMDFRYEVSMGASVRQPELASILQKALTAVPETERVRYYQRWFAVPFASPPDYSAVWWIVSGAAAILLLVLFRNVWLKRQVTRRTAELAQANEQLKVELAGRERVERELVEANERLESRVAERTAELGKAYEMLDLRAGKYRALAAELTQAENRERRRIAQVLHDQPQQMLTAAKFNMALILQRLADPDLAAPARQVMEILDQSIQDLRSLTLEISPPILHDAGLAAGLQWLARWMGEKYHLSVVIADAGLKTPLSDDLCIVLFQSVRELLFNIVKHAGVKEARVTLESAGDGLRITVRDEGKGFDAARELADTPQSFGLFHIQERLSLIHGRMDITSAPGRGTTVVLHVPLAGLPPPRADKPPAPEDKAPGAATTSHPAPSRIRVLVADDHAVVRQGLVQLLSREADLTVIGEAVDGLEAIEKARALRPDVILMDVSMPQMNGLEATRRIVSSWPEIRVIGLSLRTRDEMMAQMLEAGAKGYLVKDCPIEEIIAAIRAVAAAPLESEPKTGASPTCL